MARRGKLLGDDDDDGKRKTAKLTGTENVRVCVCVIIYKCTFELGGSDPGTAVCLAEVFSNTEFASAEQVGMMARQAFTETCILSQG